MHSNAQMQVCRSAEREQETRRERLVSLGTQQGHFARVARSNWTRPGGGSSRDRYRRKEGVAEWGNSGPGSLSLIAYR
jgi:hypothetical protein